MTSDRTNIERKTNLTKEFETVLKEAITSPYSSREPISSEITQNLCNVIEALFIHGLRDPFFLKGSRYAKYPEPNFWPFVSKFTHMSITSTVNKLSLIKTEIGKSRAWIRLILNESSLENYINLLTVEQVALNQFYYDTAYLRDAEHVDRLKGLLKGLSGLPIKAATNSSFLNTWTPSPLILAGIVAGKAVKISTLPTTQRKVYFNYDDAGFSGTDTQSTANPLLLSPIKRHNRMNNSESDSDGSSVYSHPSMVDRGEIPSRVILSSTPTDDHPYLTMAPRPMGPLLVSRRTKRARSSKSSSGSESNSKDSRSETASTIEMNPHSLPISDPLTTLQRDQSKTLDSGIASENRDVPSTSMSGIIPNWERNGSDNGIKETEKDAELDSAADKTTENVDILNDDVFDEGVNSPESINNGDISNLANESTEAAASTSVDKMEISGFSEPERNEREKTIEPEDTEKLESMAIEIPKKDSGIEVYSGSQSLHDELALLSISMDESPAGNSLTGAGVWKRPKSVKSFKSSKSSRVSSVAPSTSSETDGSEVMMSFGECLRNAMDRASPSDDELTESEDNVEEDEEEKRKAALLRQQNLIKTFTKIAIEIGLQPQDMRCPMCRKSIGEQFGFAPYGCCGVDAQYYCADCMKEGGLYSIPARVINSWDWAPREVSDRGRAFIDANLDEAVFDVMEINPKLYENVPGLNTVRDLRERLQIVSIYLFNCRESMAEDFKQRLHPRHYLYDDIHKYSFMDLQNVHSGNLERQVFTWLKDSIDHIYACVLCRQKGFICEICSDSQIIYPFHTDSTSKCPDCNALFHKHCADSGQACPRCERRAKCKPIKEATDLPFY